MPSAAVVISVIASVLIYTSGILLKLPPDNAGTLRSFRWNRILCEHEQMFIRRVHGSPTSRAGSLAAAPFQVCAVRGLSHLRKPKRS
jgi:hypothetical protein